MRGGQKPDPRVGGIGHYVRVANNTGSTVLRGDILGIDGVELSPSSYGKFEFQPVLDGVTPTASHHGKFVVAAQAIQDGKVGKAHIDGLVVVRITDLSKPWQFADVDTTDNTQLILTPNGSAQLLYKTSSLSSDVGQITTQSAGEIETISGHVLQTISGEDIGTGGNDHVVTYGGDNLGDYESANYAIVRLGCHRQAVVRGVADGTIAYGSSGTVSLWTEGGDSGDDVTAHLDWMHGDENVSSGKEVLVEWFPTESKWRIVAAECED
jgi:hypothetical protein